MKFHSLLLHHFRNYSEAAVDFGPGINLFLGENGQGKSNLLEALYFAVTGRSFRTTEVDDLIQHGAEHLFLSALLSQQEVTQHLKIGLSKEQKRVSIGGSSQTSLNALLGLLKGVIVSPEDRSLITGAPAMRRRFIDLHIAQLDPHYVEQMARYTRALRQRNLLLRQGKRQGLDIWEEQMAAPAHYLTQQRLMALEELNRDTPALLSHLSEGKEALQLRYRPRGDGDLQAILSEHRDKDLAVGHTCYGPHRDDLSLLLNGKEARYFSSEGQKICCSLALRLAEWKRLANYSMGKPLLFLDDIANALDERRKRALSDFFSEVGQVFIASSQPISFAEATCHTIKDGTFVKEFPPSY
ncbi:MAG: DNA replication/repair protein RecF [Verrucomicrobia bacterium]|nr:DNA replication/repair protein RecF [Verrucomicrobiota bacterium]